MRDLTWLLVPLRGLAQIAFADRAYAGVLVLAAVALVFPPAAPAALAGTVTGTLAGVLLPGWSREEWLIGLSGYNCAIVGLIWSGSLASGNDMWPYLVLTLLVCLALERVLPKLLRRWDLPQLSMPAVLAVFLIVLILLLADQPLPLPSAEPLFGTTGVMLAICCVIAAMASQSPVATVQAVALALVTAFMFSLILGLEILALSGLWALAVVPASFGIHGVFMAGTLTGAVAGLVAALLATLIWSVWMLSGLTLWLPPLVAPFILGTWLALLLLRWGFRKWGHPLLLQPVLWRTASRLARVRKRGRSVVVLFGSVTDGAVADPVPEYATGNWLSQQIPTDYSSEDHFSRSRQCRLLMWGTCDQFRRLCRNVDPGASHHALARMEQQGWLNRILSAEVDSRLRNAGVSRITELYGGIDRVICSGCDAQLPWPPGAVWRHYDLRCQQCGALLRPAVTAPGQGIDETTWREVEAQLNNCGILLVVGCCSTLQAPLVEQIRQSGAEVIGIGSGTSNRSLAADLQLSGPTDQILLNLLLCLKLYGLFRSFRFRALRAGSAG